MSTLLAGVDTAGVAGLLNNDFTQAFEAGFQLLPDPAGQIFTGRVFKPGDLVQVMMIKLVKHGLENSS